ncbi:MAG: LLM class F420-dependent oxidoreductase [Solirubrobacteraceae bacterium]
MEFGVAIFPTTDIQGPGELARMAQERGFGSLFFPEHTHIPAARTTPYPAGGELPPEYSRTFDPFLALTAAAAATDRIQIGTGICLVVERDPIITAKEVASLDQLSGGRFLFGVGAGWNAEEMANHGTDASRRFALMAERIEAMKAIWTEEEASYAGRFVRFERIWCWPKPLQRPHPPVLVGGNGPKVLDRVLAFGEEWMPNRVGTDEAMIERFEELGRRAGQAGREPVPITVAGMMRDPARIARFEQAGVTRGLYWVPTSTPAGVEASIDRYAAAIDEYRSAGG